MKIRILSIFSILMVLNQSLYPATSAVGVSPPTFDQMSYLLLHTRHFSWSQRWVRDWNKAFFTDVVATSRSADMFVDKITNDRYEAGESGVLGSYAPGATLASSAHKDSKALLLGLIFRRMCAFGQREGLLFDDTRSNRFWGPFLEKHILPSPRPFVCQGELNDRYLLPAGHCGAETYDNRTIGDILFGLLASHSECANDIVAALNAHRAILGSILPEGAVTTGNLHTVLAQMVGNEEGVIVKLAPEPAAPARPAPPRAGIDAGLRKAKAVSYYGTDKVAKLPLWEAEQTWAEYQELVTGLTNGDGTVKDWDGRYRGHCRWIPTRHAIKSRWVVGTPTEAELDAATVRVLKMQDGESVPGRTPGTSMTLPESRRGSANQPTTRPGTPRPAAHKPGGCGCTVS
jgi:hypothetical protein